MSVRTKQRSHPAIESRDKYHEDLAASIATGTGGEDVGLGIIQPAGAPADVPQSQPQSQPQAQPQVQPQVQPQTQPQPQAQPQVNAGHPPASTVPDQIFSFSTPQEQPVDQSTQKVKELEDKLSRVSSESEATKARLEKELEQARAERAELEELRRYRQEVELRKKLALDDIEFENLTPEAAREMSEKVFMPAVSAIQSSFEEQTKALNEQIEKTKREVAERTQRETEAQKAERLARINSELERAVPGAAGIVQSQAFAEYMRQPSAPHATTTLGEMVGMEYHKGNIAYVANAIKNFLNNRPNINDVAQAPTVTTATAPATQQSQEDLSQYTPNRLREMNLAVQTGQITKEEYREWYKKYTQYKNQ